MPAEWEEQQAVWISFPHNPDTWPINLAAAQSEMQRLVHFLSESETVRINVPTGYRETLERTFETELKADRVVLHDIPTNDAWCRDHGAIFVLSDDGDDHRDTNDGTWNDGEHGERGEHGDRGDRGERDGDADVVSSGRTLTAVNWGYNAWGGKYPPYDLDNLAAPRMAEALGVRCIDGGMILEGGAIEVDGRGVLLTTESCLLNPSRNPELTRADIESHLKERLGVTDVLWLSGGDVAGDDTDGHVDNLARFVSDDVIVHVVSEDASDVNYTVLERQHEELKEIASDRGYRLVSLPMPEPVVFDGVRLPASYGNFLITNEVVLLPSYGRVDDRARSIVQELFPSRHVQLVPTSNLVVGLGSIHCLTQQVPLGRAAR